MVPRSRGSVPGGRAATELVAAGEVGGLSSAFSGVQSNWYWASTINADNPNNAWNVNLNDGNVNNDNKTNDNHVWPVRSGE